jgi:hypothetical protein
LEGCAKLLHILHGTLIGQDFAGRGVYVYVPDGTTWRVGEGGYECAKAPDELALRRQKDRRPDQLDRKSMDPIA